MFAPTTGIFVGFRAQTALYAHAHVLRTVVYANASEGSKQATTTRVETWDFTPMNHLGMMPIPLEIGESNTAVNTFKCIHSGGKSEKMQKKRKKSKRVANPNFTEPKL